MKNTTLLEIGKGLIGFANLLGALSVINGLFGKETNVPPGLIAGIVLYLIIGAYIAGIRFIEKGSEDD